MDWSCDESQICVTLTLKDIQKSHSKTPEMEKKNDLLPVSKDCLQQGTETQEEEKVKMFCAAKRHFLLTL